MIHVTRRGAIALFAGVAAAAAAPTLAAAQEGAPPIKAIVVDTSRLARLGAGGTGEIIRADLVRSLRRIFADRMAPGSRGGATLTARIDSVQLAAYSDNSFSAFGSQNNLDYIEGAGILSVGGRVVSTTPILANVDASYSGAWNLPDIGERRLASLADIFAQWLRREMGS